MKLRGITSRIALGSAILGVLAGLFIGALNLYAEFQNRRSLAFETTERLMKATLPIVESAYWEVDVTRVQAALSGMLEDPLIVSAWVDDPILTENQRANAGLSDLRVTRPQIDFQLNWIRQAFLDQQAPIEIRVAMSSPRDASPLGDLVADLSFDSVFEEFSNRIFVVLVLSMLQALFVTLAVFALVQWLVIRPLTQLQQATQGLREEQGFHLPETAKGIFNQTKQDEISRLARAFHRTFNALEDGRKTLQKNVEDRTAELRLARNEAIAASETKSQFLANMNHELRTPLNAIAGLAEVLDNKDVPEKSRLLIQDIKSAAGQLSANINSVLDLSKIEAGEIDVRSEWFDLSDLADAVETQTRALMIARTIKLKMRLEFEASVQVFADQTRLRQIVMNFTSNAVKFTESGHICVSVSCPLDAAKTQGDLKISVLDTGQGIPEAALEDVFRPFGQVDGSTSRSHEGTGLGMSIAQHLSEALGGQIEVDSTVGVGSEFTFSMPVPCRLQAKPSDSKTEHPQAPNLEGARLLVVEDNRMNRSVFKALLERAGAIADTASDEVEAMDYLTSSVPDAILMDLHMPGSDGFSALTKMQGKLGLAIPPVVATSADATTSQKLLCKDAGFFEFIPKPVNPKELQTVMFAAVDLGSVLDRKEGLKYAGGDIDLYERSLERFRDFLQTSVLDLDTIETEALAERLHVLKGMAATVGAVGMAKMARQCETDPKTTAQLIESIHRFLEYMENLHEPVRPKLDSKALDSLAELIADKSPEAFRLLGEFDDSDAAVKRLKKALADLRFSDAQSSIDLLRQPD